MRAQQQGGYLKAQDRGLKRNNTADTLTVNLIQDNRKCKKHVNLGGNQASVTKLLVLKRIPSLTDTQ